MSEDVHMPTQWQGLEALAACIITARSCEGDTPGRLALNTSAACNDFTSSVNSVIARVPAIANDFRVKIKRLFSSRDKRLEWQFEELEANIALLEGFERMLSGAMEVDPIEANMETARQLVDELVPMPVHSSLLLRCDENISLCGMSRVQHGVDVDRSSVLHSKFLRPGEGNCVTVLCRDSAGDAVRTVSAEDVLTSFAEPELGWAVGEPVAQNSSVVVSVTPGAEAKKTCTLFVVIGGARVSASLQVGSIIEGTHVCALSTNNTMNSKGLAISPDGTVMAVSKETDHKIMLYSLPDCTFLAEFGEYGVGPGQFKYPQKLCFSQREAASLLIADSWNKRIQEMTLTGAHVRTIVVDDPSQNGVVGVVVSADLIAVGTGSGSICLFDWNSGALVRSFGEREKAEGLLGGIEGLQFTPDGSFVIVAEYYNNRLSLFTVTGEFVRCVGVGILRSPQDVGFTSSGDLLVADCNNHRICVFSPDGSTLLRSFGSRDDEPGQLKYPIALAMHNDALYVLGYTSAFVQVFT